MKVIFLDNDGVICLFDNWGSRNKKQKAIPDYEDIAPWHRPVAARFDNFDSKAIAVLNDILTKTGAEIVVSSDWRRSADLEELGEYYLEQGICKAPIGLTPVCADIEDSKDTMPAFRWGDRDEYLERERYVEIMTYLNAHSEITHWVAVDDLNMGTTAYGADRGWGLTNFAYTPIDTEGIKQTGVAKKILEFLRDSGD